MCFPKNPPHIAGQYWDDKIMYSFIMIQLQAIQIDKLKIFMIFWKHIYQSKLLHLIVNKYNYLGNYPKVLKSKKIKFVNLIVS